MSNQLGENLKMIRKKWGIGQRELGELLGTNRSVIASYEAKSKFPKIETLFLLEEITSIRGKDLFFTKLLPEQIPIKPIVIAKNILNEPLEKYNKIDLSEQVERLKERIQILEKTVLEMNYHISEMKKKVAD